MRPLIPALFVALVGVPLCPLTLQGQETRIAKQHDPWGRFKPGAWKLMRLTTEVVDEQGRVTSVSFQETESTLVRVEDDGLTLLVEAIVEVAGRRLRAQPKTFKQGYHGELVCLNPQIKHLESAELVIEGQSIECQIEQLEFSSPAGKATTKIYYSPTVAPYVLRKESVTKAPDDGTAIRNSVTETLARELPYRVLSEMKSTALTKTVQKHAKGSTITYAFTSPDVPGGIVAQHAKDLDEKGQVIRRSVLELIDYGLETREARTGLFGRRRPLRLRESGPRLFPH